MFIEYNFLIYIKVFAIVLRCLVLGVCLCMKLLAVDLFVFKLTILATQD